MFFSGCTKSSVRVPLVLSPLAANETPPEAAVTETLSESPTKSSEGDQAGIVPEGLICRNFVARPTKAFFAVGE